MAIIGRNEERGRDRVRAIESGRRHGNLPDRRRPGSSSLARARDAIRNNSAKLRSWSTPPAATTGCDAAARQRFLPVAEAAWSDVFDLNLVGGVLLPCQVFGETMLAAGRRKHHQHRLDGRHDSACRAWSPTRPPKRR